MLLIMIAGFMGFMPAVNGIILVAVYTRTGFVVVSCLLAGAWIWAHQTRKIIWGQLRLTYDDAPEPAVRSLNLGIN
jgi:hypothetical protein